MAFILGPFIALLVLSVALGALERRYGRTRPPLRSRGVDVGYWLAQAWVFAPASKVLIVLALLPAMLAISVLRGRSLDELALGHGPVLALPRWAQALLALLIADGVGYAMHRLFHCAPLWRAHAIHHSSTHLDFLSAARGHPLNEVMPRIAQAWVVLAVGVPIDVLAWATPLFFAHGLLLHTQVPWDFGPLRFVFASPRFHRWHHANDPEARDKNFAGMFSFIDVLFGTYYLPRGRDPDCFGVDDAVPPGMLAQLRWPFRSR